MNTMQRKRNRLPKPAACILICLLIGATGFCYAADVGGIQRQVQLWINGEQTDCVIEFHGSGEYSMEFTDENGETHTQRGGGVAYDFFGNERPLTEEELLEELNAPDVRYLEDGSVMVYYYGQATDITDKFENGACHVQLVHDREVLYMTVRYQDGFSTSSKHFVDP